MLAIVYFTIMKVRLSPTAYHVLVISYVQVFVMVCIVVCVKFTIVLPVRVLVVFSNALAVCTTFFEELLQQISIEFAFPYKSNH